MAIELKNQYNPDVLTCLANLSNDEVFTPPDLVNKMLDTLPAELWQNKDARFLDPVTKSGAFLREIAKRLNKGLKEQIPNQQARINHIFTQQLFGIAITELTSLLARRSVYCSKTANGQYSICDSFSNIQGNIRFKAIKHTWQAGKCKFCGASQSEYDRADSLESHAYEFIHTDNPSNTFGKDMKFDVIIGNPPYQLSDGGAQVSASPIYHKFIQQAKKLNPRYLTMIVPARWYAGGKGLDDFRAEMLNDERLKEIHDFPETSDCFRGLNIRGGVCYFLWDSSHKGNCKVINYRNGVGGVPVERPLLEKNIETFIRYNESISILKKVQHFNEESFSKFVSSRKPFGLPTNYSDFKKQSSDKYDILLYRFGDNAYINIEQVDKNKAWVNKTKIIVPYASPGSDVYPHLILSKPIILMENTCCTETYLVIGPFATNVLAKTIQQYMVTRFFRFMILLTKNTQHITKQNYSLVPVQDFSQGWTDAKLYAKYGLNQDEIDFIESMIRPMELADE